MDHIKFVILSWVSKLKLLKDKLMKWNNKIIWYVYHGPLALLEASC